MGEQETVIYEVLRKAQADGTLSQTQDGRALARFFLGVAVGINAVNKSVADPGVFQGYGQSRDDRLEHAGPQLSAKVQGSVRTVDLTIAIVLIVRRSSPADAVPTARSSEELS